MLMMKVREETDEQTCACHFELVECYECIADLQGVNVE